MRLSFLDLPAAAPQQSISADTTSSHVVYLSSMFLVCIHHTFNNYVVDNCLAFMHYFYLLNSILSEVSCYFHKIFQLFAYQALFTLRRTTYYCMWFSTLVYNRFQDTLVRKKCYIGSQGMMLYVDNNEIIIITLTVYFCVPTQT